MRVDEPGGTGSPFDLPPGNPDGIRSAARSLRQAASNVATLGAQVRRRGVLTTETAQWHGAANNAYTSTYGAATDVAAGLEAPLRKLAGVTSTYADALDTAQKRISRALDAYTAAMTKGDKVIADYNDTKLHTPGDADAAKAALAACTKEMDAATLDAEHAWEAFKVACGTAIRDAEACRTGAEKGSEGSWFAENLELLKSANERFHGVWDTSGLDHRLGVKVDAAANQVEGARTAYRDAMSAETARAQEITELEAARNAGYASEADLAELSKLRGEQVTGAFQLDELSRTYQSTALLARGGQVVRFGLGSGAIAADVMTLIAPEDHGTMGNVDRGVAATNAGLVGWDMAGNAGLLRGAMTLPGPGEVIMIGTGVYLGGNYLYHHWSPFHDFADTAGHNIVTNITHPSHLFEFQLP